MALAFGAATLGTALAQASLLLPEQLRHLLPDALPALRKRNAADLGAKKKRYKRRCGRQKSGTAKGSTIVSLVFPRYENWATFGLRSARKRFFAD